MNIYNVRDRLICHGPMAVKHIACVVHFAFSFMYFHVFPYFFLANFLIHSFSKNFPSYLYSEEIYEFLMDDHGHG